LVRSARVPRRHSVGVALQLTEMQRNLAYRPT
jgi:hypothetical protein